MLEIYHAKTNTGPTIELPGASVCLRKALDVSDLPLRALYGPEGPLQGPEGVSMEGFGWPKFHQKAC